MYEDDDYSKRDSRPLSFIASGHGEVPEENSYFDQARSYGTRPSPSINGSNQKAYTAPGMLPGQRKSSLDHGPLSPTHSLRDHAPPSPADTANSQFPLNDIDYESNPAAVAQELSNLQALRRMSMDVGSASDPDLPSFQGGSFIPSVAPKGDDDEDDPSRLFWVPARVHPELAPMEFKTFLENRVQTIKRRSGDQSSLTPDSIERSGSGGGLRRKKSMLSRQIDNSGGRGAMEYQDGAERLVRKKSLSNKSTPELKISDLQELDALIKDPSKALQKLSLEGHRTSLDDEGLEDMPILPAPPGGMALRRSTRTTYRKGSLRKGERVPFSKRAGARVAETDSEDSPTASPITGPGVGFPLIKTQSEPTQPANFSRPARSACREPITQAPSDRQRPPSIPAPIVSPTLGDIFSNIDSTSNNQPTEASPVQYESDARSRANAPFQRSETPVPQIVETPPPEDEHASALAPYYPERSSSQHQSLPQINTQLPSEPPPRSSKRPPVTPVISGTPGTPVTPMTPGTPGTPGTPVVRQQPSSPAVQKGQNVQTLNDMTQQPSPLPGNSTRTDSLTVIPTMPEDKKADKKSKDKKSRDDSENSGPRKTSWGWFKGGDDKKDKKKNESKQAAKQDKAHAAGDKSHDNTRLDVLQNSIDGTINRGRESLLLDRESIDNKLHEERQKESGRKSGEHKKEKDGLFSSLFGGGKKKNDRDSGGKRGSSLRTLSPDPPPRLLKPDIDYNWTRFSILEERAIYRMAHIKLANPRRALYSQVLLSNFMYSYLAKVQQMHPHVQVPQSAQQKKLQEAEQRRKEQEQAYQEQQRQQEQDGGYKYDYHSVGFPGG
jgi:hypothetical protein